MLFILLNLGMLTFVSFLFSLSFPEGYEKIRIAIEKKLGAYHDMFGRSAPCGIVQAVICFLLRKKVFRVVTMILTVLFLGSALTFL